MIQHTGSTFLFLMLCGAGAVAQYDNCTNGNKDLIGDYMCNNENNNEECAYDGGDCCPCTNYVSWFDDVIPEYFETFCRDPSSGCLDTRLETYPNCTDGFIPDIGDGWCDMSNNNEACHYDGGDCCECGGAHDGSSFSLCVDPGDACYNSDVMPLQSTCITGSIDLIGNGLCNDENNVEDCGYDGGDCCICTCAHGKFFYCGSNGFGCVDPNVIGQDMHLCVESPPTIPACPTGLQSEWVVENATQARELVEAIRCSGGSFHVTWKNKVTLDETVSISDGTFLNVTSASASNAVIVGDGKSRLFAVVNASLHLCNVTLSNGNATYGGAVAASRSKLTFDRVVFAGNVASSGGALYLSYGTYVSFDGKTVFYKNTAFQGGALYMTGGSAALWTRNTTFTENTATSGDGGALYVTDSSYLSWTGSSIFSENRCEGHGGALYLTDGSLASWTGNTTFTKNSANSGYGGALFILYGSAVWTATTHFSGNSALYGGALMVAYRSKATWAAESYFLANIANVGGALCLLHFSNASWAGNTFFSANTANLFGGGLYLEDDSIITWTAESHFLGNHAGYEGGAMLVEEGCRATWAAFTIFYANSVDTYGGAIWAGNGAFLSWSKNTLFINNTAGTGGALFVTDGVGVEWSGETSFISNFALKDGGAVGSVALNSVISVYWNNKKSTISMKGKTRFVNNMCGVNGGGMALVQSLAVSFESDDITLFGNVAGRSGGAVFIGSTGIGTVFVNVRFVENVAQIGGGVLVTQSGNTKTVDTEKRQVENPTTFDRCSFIGNAAFGTGGAVDTASGQDAFVGTLFERNTAKMGGALRLAGKASVVNCSFNENVSELGGGPAVSNIGAMDNVNTCSFHRNVFNCEPQTFLEFIKSDDAFQTVCDGCPETCFECSFGRAQGSPTCTSLSEAGVEHATSLGGNTTVEGLDIHEGYWRATNTSREIFECFNKKSCAGGLTGASNYCLLGYEGPYCSICSKNYAPSLNFTCRECSKRSVSVSIAVALTVLASAIGIAFVWYLVYGDLGGAGGGTVDRAMRRIPIHSVKIIITMWQILTQFTFVSSVTFPNVYQTFLDGVNFLNFDLSWVLSVGCFLELDFHDRLLWVTIAPVVIMVLLRVTYAIAMHKHRGSSETLSRKIRQKHVLMALLVTVLVYSSVSSVVFQMFACDRLDTGKSYLRADYTIDCDSRKHRALQIYAGVMIILYPVGIPSFYAHLLFSNSHVLRDEKGREVSRVVMSFSNLWKPYKPQWFFYEVIECSRRVLLTGAVVFIYPNTASQIAVTFVIAVVFLFVSEAMAPYNSIWDAWTSRIGHGVIFASMYLAFLLKVDVSGEKSSSQKAFEVVLVGVHGCMVLALVVQAVVIAMSMRATKQLQDPIPKLSRLSNFA